jgi:hypothetical protein
MKPNQTQSHAAQLPKASYLIQRCGLALLTLLLWAGCKPEGGSSSGTSSAGAGRTEPNPVGTYALESVDGKALPCTLQHEGQSPTIKSGTFVINADGTCSSKVNFSLPTGGDNSREVKATFKRDGAKLTMKWEGAGTTTGMVESNTFTLNNEGMTFTFRK